MPRNADRIIGHLVGQRGSTLSTSSQLNRMSNYRSSLCVYRPSHKNIVCSPCDLSVADTLKCNSVRQIPIKINHKRFIFK